MATHSVPLVPCTGSAECLVKTSAMSGHNSGALMPYGLTNDIAERFEAFDAPRAALPGRVRQSSLAHSFVVVPGGDHLVHHSNPRTKTSGGTNDVPVTGDWVVVNPDPSSGYTIIGILPRYSVLARQKAGDRLARQVLAANVDSVFVVHALDRPVNQGRLERMLVMVWAGGGRPVVILTKVDIASDTTKDSTWAQLATIAPGCPIHVTSAITGEGVATLAQYTTRNETVALIGESGAGKSQLVNRLVGTDVQSVAAVRASDHKGRHATTTRDLVPLPNGGVLLDTPGLRGVGLWDADEGLDLAFPEIALAALGCRFSDCAHESEPGCTVRSAVMNGDVDARRLERFLRLDRELDERKREHVQQGRRTPGRPSRPRWSGRDDD